MELTQALVRELLDADYQAGTLTWRERPGDKSFNNQRANKPALTSDKDGYKYGIINGKHYQAHRVIFLHAHGYLPEQVDHENGDRTDNRISNLKPADQGINSRNAKKYNNNKSGITGVTWSKDKRKWRAEIRHQKKHYHLGYHTTKEEAATAIESARITLGGFSERHGK